MIPGSRVTRFRPVHVSPVLANLKGSARPVDGPGCED